MGSKAPAPPSEPVQPPPQTDYSGLFTAFGEMMNMSQQQTQLYRMQQEASLANMPEPTPTVNQDWKQRNDDLKRAIEDDVTRKANMRRGRASTIRTSLLDEDEFNTVST